MLIQALKKRKIHIGKKEGSEQKAAGFKRSPLVYRSEGNTRADRGVGAVCSSRYGS